MIKYIISLIYFDWMIDSNSYIGSNINYYYILSHITNFKLIEIKPYWFDLIWNYDPDINFVHFRNIQSQTISNLSWSALTMRSEF